MSDIKANFNSKEYKYILIVAIFAVGVLFFTPMSLFAPGFMGAITFYVLLRNQNKALVEKRKWKKAIASSVILLETVIIFLIPLAISGLLIAIIISNIDIDLPFIQKRFFEFITFIEEKLEVDFLSQNNLDRLLSLQTVSKFQNIGGKVLRKVTFNSYSIVLNSGIMLFVLYFMFYHYKEFEALVHEILPFKEKNKAMIKKETKLVIKANAIGIPLIALIQGVLSYFGYLIFGVSNPLLFSLLTAFATIIPGIGAALIYVPVIVSLLIQGIYPNAIGLLAYSVLIVSSSDNIIRLLLQLKIADIHPLITFFGVFTGLIIFGFWGIIYGPLLLSLFVLMINMYRNDYVENTTVKLNPNLEKEQEKRLNLKGVELIKKMTSKKGKNNHKEK